MNYEFFCLDKTNRIKMPSLGYDAVLAIVIAELVFAFSVGLICVIFSLNLFLSLKDSQDTTSLEDLTAGDLPRPRSTY